MIESIKNELYKSLHNKLFAISMIIAFIIQIFSVQPNAAFKNEALEHYLTTSSMGGVSNKVFFESFDIYTFWIGIEGVSMGCYLSKYLIPILAVLPFGWSFLSEQKKGYQIQTVSRIGKANYFISKYIATFISGALPTAFILLSNYASITFLQKCVSVYADVDGYQQLMGGSACRIDDGGFTIYENKYLRHVVSFLYYHFLGQYMQYLFQ